MKRFITIAALAITATGMATVSVDAQNANQRGPLPFSVFDMNNDGAITRAEFDEVRAKRQAASGGLGRNQANAPGFEAIDANGDGTITQAEFTEYRANNMLQRPGMGQGMGGNRGRN
ncbi:MAG: EF-hand domain-containing protein [Rhodobacteraceae bacterium]|nr:EF-hand domain-containing protein [Paracoccaceae bacterium]